MNEGPGSMAELIERMGALLAPLEEARDERRHFLATYRRTRIAVHAELERGGFEDAAWVEQWDLVFAGLYLEALEQWNAGTRPSAPWAVAFAAAANERVPPLRHVLLGMNAHINYDLPQALLASITPIPTRSPGAVGITCTSTPCWCRGWTPRTASSRTWSNRATAPVSTS